MPGSLGAFGFAWSTSSTPFTNALWLDGEKIFGFTLSQNEGEFANLEIELENPRIGLLNPNRLQWAWFSWKDIIGVIGPAGTIYPLFYGRLISFPTDFLSNAITLRFEARPLDYLIQQQALAQGLMVRPYWDPVFITAERRLDPDTVLEGRSAIWHVDRLTLTVSISGLLVGEAGTIAFGQNDAFWESVKVSIDKPPLKSVYVEGTVDWDQQDTNLIDMGQQVAQTYSGDGIINSWPKPLSQLGAGWSVQYSAAVDSSNTAITTPVTLTVRYQNRDQHHSYGDVMSYTLDWTRPSFVRANDQLGTMNDAGHFIISQYNKIAIIDQDPNGFNDPTAEVRYTDMWVLPWTVQTSLVLRYDAKRHRTEQIRFTLPADVQAVFTDPGGQAANFAQDSELISIQGSVGIEGPFGTFRGNWTADTLYSLYDYFMVGTNAYMTLRDHLSAATFDPLATADVWQPNTFYGAGENVQVPGAFGPLVYTVMQSTLSGFTFDPTTIGNDLTLVYQLQVNPHAGPPLYQFLPNFRGDWASGTVYVTNDIFIGPDGNTYSVQIGHTSTSFFEFNTDPTGRLLYGLLLNPAPIGDISSAQYFPTDRGLWSLEYLIMLARAKLIFRSRSVKISFDAHFEKVLGLTLRHNASLADPRLPGGTASGKVTAYALRATEEQGPIGNVTISCCVGEGNSVHPSAGTPDYVNADYVNPDYQVYDGVLLAPGAGDILYGPPIYGPNDDGLVFPLNKAQAVISETFQSASTISEQQVQLAIAAGQVLNEQQQQLAAGQPIPLAQLIIDRHSAAKTAMAQAMAKTPYWYQLVLKPVVNGPFSTEYDVTVSNLMLPKNIDLSAPSGP